MTQFNNEDLESRKEIVEKDLVYLADYVLSKDEVDKVLKELKGNLSCLRFYEHSRGVDNTEFYKSIAGLCIRVIDKFGTRKLPLARLIGILNELGKVDIIDKLQLDSLLREIKETQAMLKADINDMDKRQTMLSLLSEASEYFDTLEEYSRALFINGFDPRVLFVFPSFKEGQNEERNNTR